MATIPSNTRFIGISPRVSLKERRSKSINSETQSYTMQDIVDTTRPYKVYTALLTYSGTGDVEVNVLENTLGETVTWTPGETENNRFFGNVSNPLFISNKTIGFAYSGGDAEDTYLGFLVSSNGDSTIMLNDPSGTGNYVQIRVEIRVYN